MYLFYYELTIENIDWETNSNLRTVFSHLATAIKEIVSIDNGPYALVLWTKHHELIDSFKSYILHRYKDSSFPHPFFVSHLDKNSFNNSAIRPQELVDALFESTILQKLMSFENLLHQEVYNLTSEIINLASSDFLHSWQHDGVIKSNFTDFLRKMAVQNSGYEIAKENPSKALAEAISPILKYKIEKSSEASGIWDDILNISSINKKDINFPEGFKISKLNNFFHIDKTPNDYNTRGAVFSLNKEDDFFKDKFGIKKSSTFIENTIRGFSRENRDKVDFIIIEISAACDYSQNKPRLHKYILGLKIPTECYDLYKEQLKVGTGSLPDATLDFSFRFKELENENEFNILLNLNFVCTLNVDEKNRFSHIFTFKKQIIDYISNKYANHSSRIGITSY